MTTCNFGSLARRAVAIVITATFALCPVLAAAQSAQDQATARALFNESRRLMKAGRYEEACAKLEGASRLYPGSGVLLNLGDCYEHLGRTASAWTEFGEAMSAAERSSRLDDAAEAKKRQAQVEPKLSYLVIRVSHEAPGLVVKRDGSPIVRAAWGEAIPIDPGTHPIVAEAEGRVPWTGSVTVTAGGKITIDVPELAPAQPPPPEPKAIAAFPPPAPEPAATPTPERYWTGRRIGGATVAGLGVIGAGVGAALVLVAKANDNAAEDETTGTHRHADSLAAVNMGNAGSIVLVGGAVIAASGVLLWLTAPSAPVQVGASGRGIVVGGSF